MLAEGHEPIRKLDPIYVSQAAERGAWTVGAVAKRCRRPDANAADGESWERATSGMRQAEESGWDIYICSGSFVGIYSTQRKSHRKQNIGEREGSVSVGICTYRRLQIVE